MIYYPRPQAPSDPRFTAARAPRRAPGWDSWRSRADRQTSVAPKRASENR